MSVMESNSCFASAICLGAHLSEGWLVMLISMTLGMRKSFYGGDVSYAFMFSIRSLSSL